MIPMTIDPYELAGVFRTIIQDLENSMAEFNLEIKITPEGRYIVGKRIKDENNNS